MNASEFIFMKRVIVTGATSMLGVALIKECIKENVEVCAIIRKNTTRMSRLPNSPLITYVECDMSELCTVRLPNEEYDCMFHMAWGYTGKDVRDNPELQNKNIAATLDAVRLAHQYHCKKFVGAGSQAEYGIATGPIHEDLSVAPVSAYGICKYAAGRLAEKLCGALKMTYVWARIFSVYGTNDKEGTMIKYAFEQMRNGETAHFSAGTHIWNYLFETDAGKMIYLLGKTDEACGIYNVAHPDSRPLRDYISEMKRVLGDNFVYELSPENSLTAYDLIPDVSKIINCIRYVPEVSFGAGIEILFEKENR